MYHERVFMWLYVCSVTASTRVSLYICQHCLCQETHDSWNVVEIPTVTGDTMVLLSDRPSIIFTKVCWGLAELSAACMGQGEAA